MPTVQTRRAIEVRPAARLIKPTVETRSADESLAVPSKYEITGYAAVFNVVTELSAGVTRCTRK